MRKKVIGKRSYRECSGDELMGKVKLGRQGRGKDKENQNDRVGEIEVSVPTVFAAG